MTRPYSVNRRRFLVQTGALGLGSAMTLSACRTNSSDAPAIIIADKERPVLPSGIQIGDVTEDRAIVWARSDRTARMRVEFDTTSSFKNPQRITGPIATDVTDFTSRIELTNLPADQSIFLRVSYDNINNLNASSIETLGQFRTAPSQDSKRAVRFVWGGDVAGQGWGINLDFGGMKIYEAMRLRQPDFFLHSGDSIYADGPILAETKAEEGRIWRNIVTPEVSKVAETLNEFRGRYRYNLMDTNVLRFSAEVPQIWQWDDHEVLNNWSPSKDLSEDPRYTEKNVQNLVARAAQAFKEYSPMRWGTTVDTQRIYRKINRGPLLDIFVLDMRTYRGGNSYNLQTSESVDTAFIGKAQIEWLKSQLKQSTATWKIIQADMPIGLFVPDGKDSVNRDKWEAIANGNYGAPLGRELEIAGLLSAIKDIKNIVWLTADVHYCAAHYYDPTKAQFTDFSPFWEFVAGPLNAGTFGPNPLDATFGPQLIFQKTPALGQSNLSPFAGLQFFGEINIDPLMKTLTVDLRDINGISVFTKVLLPVS